MIHIQLKMFSLYKICVQCEESNVENKFYSNNIGVHYEKTTDIKLMVFLDIK